MLRAKHQANQWWPFEWLPLKLPETFEWKALGNAKGCLKKVRILFQFIFFIKISNHWISKLELDAIEKKLKKTKKDRETLSLLDSLLERLRRDAYLVLMFYSSIAMICITKFVIQIVADCPNCSKSWLLLTIQKAIFLVRSFFDTVYIALNSIWNAFQWRIPMFQAKIQSKIQTKIQARSVYDKLR